MDLSKALAEEGVHKGLIPGPVGMLEVVVDRPVGADMRYLAVIGHPHSLQGGTMDNKVVTTMAKVFRELNIASIRFNFRGVGRSEGLYDNGVGESDDMLHLLRLSDREDLTVFFVGFSFGSYVAFRTLTQYQHEYAHPTTLITIAPPVHHYDYSLPLSPQTPWIVVQGDNDEVVPVADVLAFVKQRNPSPQLEYFKETGHFFHGKLLELRTRMIACVQQWIKPQ